MNDFEIFMILIDMGLGFGWDSPVRTDGTASPDNLHAVDVSDCFDPFFLGSASLLVCGDNGSLFDFVIFLIVLISDLGWGARAL